MKVAIYLSLFFFWALTVTTLGVGIKEGVAGVIAFLIFAGSSYVSTKTGLAYIKEHKVTTTK